MITHSVVIHLARRVDRWANVQQICERVPGVEIYSPVSTDPDPSWVDSRGAWGNRQSHLAVLRTLVHSDVALILEDDADVTTDFIEELARFAQEAPTSWESLFLGGEHRWLPEQVSTGVQRCRKTMRTHAYVVRGEAIEVAARAASSSTTHWDEGLAKALGRRGRTYAPDPFLVGVIDTPSDTGAPRLRMSP